MSVSFSGLASGIDSTALIKSLVDAYKSPESRVQSNQSNLRTQQDTIATLEKGLTDLGSAAHLFDLGSEAQTMTATGSDATHLSVAASGGATAGSHAIRVLDTAQAQVVSSKTFASAAAGVLGAGSVTMQRAGQSDVQVSWTSTDSLATIADRITQAGAGVSASVLYDGTNYRLLVGATATGTAAAATFVDGGDGLGLADPNNITAPARDASVSIDGVKITRGSNVIDDALPGVTITALQKQAVGDADTRITVGIDATATRATVQKLVDAYNSVAALMSDQLSYKGFTKGGDSLFGDVTIQGLQRSFAGLITTSPSAPALAALGLSLGRDGQLSIDSAKFDKAVTADPTAVKTLFTTGGFAKTISDLGDQYTRAGDGILESKNTGLNSRIKVYQDQIDAIETRASALQDRLQKQFDALEMTMSKLKASSTYLTSLANQKLA